MVLKHLSVDALQIYVVLGIPPQVLDHNFGWTVIIMLPGIFTVMVTALIVYVSFVIPIQMQGQHALHVNTVFVVATVNLILMIVLSLGEETTALNFGHMCVVLALVVVL